MTTPRIGDQGLAGPNRLPTSAAPTASARFGAALASPLGILVVVPGLVAALGLFLTLSGQGALRNGSRELGRQRFAEQTAFVARSVSNALANADPMLDRMHELVERRTPDDPLGPFAHSLRALMAGRAGISYASVSFPDGTFQGAYLDEDGAIRFQESRVTKDGTVVHRYDFSGTDGLQLRKDERSTYDPREREFYRVAVARKARAWTKPYVFFRTHYTGVTRVDPVYEAGAPGTLHAVVTADFDVNALSASIERAPVPLARTLLYANDGTVLAYPEGASLIAGLPLRADRPLEYGDLGDPVVSRFFSNVVPSHPHDGDFTEFSVDGANVLAMVTGVPRFPELGWSAAAIVPESLFFSAWKKHQKESLAGAVVALALALGVSLVFARHVVRARQEVAEARDAAREATERAKELGSYRLVKRLGEGGMGEVWRAEHRLLQREAAIKLIRAEALASAAIPPEELRERFRREAQTLATLKSRHTIELFDYGVTEDGTFFFVMELLDGLDLDTLVDTAGPLPVGRVIHFLRQACSSLAEAHDAGLVHRDIKPANLFACRAADEVDVLKVLDFGLVQAEPERPRAASTVPPSADPTPSEPRLTRAGQYMGTPAFMPPEQALGQDADGRSDLYALACVGMYLLSGQLLYDADDGMAFILAHVKDPIPDLRAMVPGHFPEELEAILRKCLSKSRHERPADARAVAEALRNVPLPESERWTEDAARIWWAARYPDA